MGAQTLGLEAASAAAAAAAGFASVLEAREAVGGQTSGRKVSEWQRWRGIDSGTLHSRMEADCEAMTTVSDRTVDAENQSKRKEKDVVVFARGCDAMTGGG